MWKNGGVAALARQQSQSARGDARRTIFESTDKEPDLHPALSGDEVYTPSPRRSEGWCGQLFARCSNRTTSKTSILTLNEQRNLHRSTHT